MAHEIQSQNMPQRKPLTHERLLEALSHDPETGIFIWKISRRGSHRRPGDVAGRWMAGYISILIDKRAYRAHRLAWFYVHGEWPPNGIDHKDRVRDNNTLANLRLATSTQNKQNLPIFRNNKSGVKGVCWDSERQKWSSRIKLKDKHLHLGRFREFSAAVAVRKAAELKYYGEFASS